MADITKDPAYNAVAPDDFKSMIEVDRYNARTPHFDKIITATHSHFWDPLDKKYIDYDTPFDMNKPMLPMDFVAEMNTPIGQRMSEAERVAFVNENFRWMLSSILHGEQGALSLSASLCHVLKDPGAQEYASNQAREEARHVLGFARYIETRWGEPLPCGDTLANLLEEMVNAPEVYKKLVGMQMLVEGLAMGAFASIFEFTNDPLARHLTQLVMTDEAFHHKFGKIWADKTMPHVSEEERHIIEDWAAECFQTLLFNLGAPFEKRVVYEKFGIDWEEATAEIAKVITVEKRREVMSRQSSIFRVLIKTLLNAGIITDRTKALYATYVDMDELQSEGDEMVGDAIAADGIKFLERINFRSDAEAAE